MEFIHCISISYMYLIRTLLNDNFRTEWVCLLQAAQSHVPEVGVETTVDALQQIVIHRQDEAIGIAMTIATHGHTKRSENAGFPLKLVIHSLVNFIILKEVDPVHETAALLGVAPHHLFDVPLPLGNSSEPNAPQRLTMTMAKLCSNWARLLILRGSTNRRWSFWSNE
jgi:hypothetical protein